MLNLCDFKIGTCHQNILKEVMIAICGHFNIVLYGFLILAMVSCKQEVNNQLLSITEVAFEETAPGFKITDSFSKVRALQLEINSECTIGNIRKILSIEDELIVLTKEDEIFCFDKVTGKFLRQIGQRGEGPGEYISIMDIYYNGKDKTINIISRIPAQFITYTLQGDFIKKESTDIPLEYAWGATRSSDGWLMISNELSGCATPSEYAFTVVSPSGEQSSLDRFPSVGMGNYSTPFAGEPAVAIGEKITFFKFLNDTIFVMKNGGVTPVYHLEMKKKFPKSEILDQMGDFGMTSMRLDVRGEYFSGFDKIFETEQYIVLIPKIEYVNGQFWIDKETSRGYHFSETSEVKPIVTMMLKGEIVPYVYGSGKEELISSFEESCINETKEVLADTPDFIPFNEKVAEVFENADPNGNPVVVIYEH